MCISEEHLAGEKKLEECTVLYKPEVETTSRHHHFSAETGLLATAPAWIQGSSPGLTPPRRPGEPPLIHGESPLAPLVEHDEPEEKPSPLQDAFEVRLCWVLFLCPKGTAQVGAVSFVLQLD